ncbi:hypothetical protein MKW92_008594 [Papaver armeniacum]|nr:hypothetical protein MKW92_008594 [Papaver armeniacum]
MLVGWCINSYSSRAQSYIPVRHIPLDLSTTEIHTHLVRILAGVEVLQSYLFSTPLNEDAYLVWCDSDELRNLNDQCKVLWKCKVPVLYYPVICRSLLFVILSKPCCLGAKLYMYNGYGGSDDLLDTWIMR